MTYINQQDESIMVYGSVVKIGNIGAVNKVKMKVIQEMIHVECPFNWSIKIINKN